MAATGRDYVGHEEFQEFRAEVKEGLDAIGARFDHVDARFDRVDAKLEATDAKLDAIDARDEGQDVQLRDLRALYAQMAGQLASIIALLTESTDIQRRQLGLLEAAQRA